MIRILITEDSDVVSLLLTAMFAGEDDMQVIGRARNGQEAVRMAHSLKPDLITMDIRMPVMDGFEATRQIMSTEPVPIIVISSNVDNEELRISFRAIEAGALSIIEKPVGLGHPDFETIRGDMIDTVRIMAEVKVIRRRYHARKPAFDVPGAVVTPARKNGQGYELIAIGCSTGGPQALSALLSALPAAYSVPMVIIQHMSKGFIGGLVSWLQSQTPLHVRLAQDWQHLDAGTVYIAPDDCHLLVERGVNGLIARLDDAPVLNGFRPSVTQLLSSVALTCGSGAVGLLLTGMGSDGADGLLAMRRAGAHTLVQDEESAVVYGMPGAAIAIDAVDQVVQLDKMPAYLTDLVC
jgi:two-component system, chemotaxis family, protein-glutamate methylesterase/glutaminase